MKTLLACIACIGVGYLLNTETSKKVVSTGYKFAKEKTGKLVNKINESLEDSSSEKTDVA